MNVFLKKIVAQPGSIPRPCRKALAALIIMGMAGCSLAPEYQRPDLSVPSFLAASAVKDSAGGDADAHGPAVKALSPQERQFFAAFSPRYDLALLVDKALQHNRDLRLATLRVEEARAMYRIQNADKWPAAGLGVQYNREQINNTVDNSLYGENLSVAGVGFSDYELDFFGRVRNLSESAKHDYLATVYAQQAGRAALIVEVARIYLTERATAEMQAALYLVYMAQQETQAIGERRVHIGSMSAQDVLEQRNTVEHARLQWQQSQFDHVRAQHALQLITGYAADDLQLAGTLADLTTDSSDAAAWFANEPSEVLTHRPDILQAEEKLRAANAVIGAARADFFPSIQLTTGIGTASASLHGLIDAGTGAWLFTPQVTLPIFSGGRNRANLELAQTRKQMAIAEYEKAVQSAFREVADALAARERLADQVRTEQSQLEVEQEQAHKVAAHFDAGWSDRPTLLAAQIRLEQSDLSCIQARETMLLNWLDLYRAFYGTYTAD